MKKLILTLSIICIGIIAYAQKTEEGIIRDVFKLEKKATVAEFLQLSNDDATKFWPIYDQYEIERSKIGSKRIQLITDYVEKYATMDDVSLDKLVEESGSIQKSEIALREKFYKKIKKEISTSIGARFYQIEDAINISVRMSLYQELPMLQGK
ncbi:MAG TPA: hypothetical protein PLJ60_02405 [Chryseolinea sp.]|nr:hypothetical protein [Chryseolinea sp.]